MSSSPRRPKLRSAPKRAVSTEQAASASQPKRRWSVLLRRVVARIVDSSIMVAVAFMLWLVVWIIVAASYPRTTDPLADVDRVNLWFSSNMGWLTVVTVIGVLLGYEAIMLRLTSSTVGKRLMRLQIRRHSDNAALTWAQTVTRTLLTVATPVVSQICWLSAIWRRDGRGIHDRLLNSVIKEHTEPSEHAEHDEQPE